MDVSIKPIRSDVFKYLTSCKSKFDLIFADPPFDATYRDELHQTVFEKELLNTNGVLVVEHPSRESMAHLHSFEFERKYGNVAFSFFIKFEKE